MMPPTSPLPSTAAEFEDPRKRSDFEPEHWPLCNGQPAPPPDSNDPHARRCIEFLAAYYEVNCRHAEHQAARAAAADDAEIRVRLEAVSAALEAVDALEDRYVSIGFYGEPIMDGIMYRDIHFVHVGSSVPQVLPTPVSSHFAIPGLDEIPASELVGEPKIFRFDNGKVDL